MYRVIRKVPLNKLIELEDWEQKLIIDVDCYLGKSKVHLYESNYLFIDPSQFDLGSIDHYKIIDSYIISLTILDALRQTKELELIRDTDVLPRYILCIRRL